ncbi:MAG: helix-turn-helix domain-containing protein [Verrucomicrobia bacterium]|nr:helix-turn-helix domain-containing protein [Verrucomicrobiota bacterium]
MLEKDREKIIENTRLLLKKRRIELGISMNRAGEIAGLSQQTISYVERGLRDPTLGTLLRICEALEIKISDLLEKAENPESKSLRALVDAERH